MTAGYARHLWLRPTAALCQLLLRFRDGGATVNQVFRQQRDDMPNGGNHPGQFLNFFTGTAETGLRLNLDRIAFANAAWCSTLGNSYPAGMLRHCMQRFTRRLIETPRPGVVNLSGAEAKKYEVEIKSISPLARIIRTISYANRSTRNVKAKEIGRVRNLLRA